jgi:hypothetical protein
LRKRSDENLKMATAMYVETLENLQDYTCIISESRSYETPAAKTFGQEFS